MANAIEYITAGRDTYAGRNSAWHELGEVTGRFMTWRELYVKAQADYEVFKAQLEYQGKLIDSYGTFRRNKDGSERFLSNVGKDYNVIQHTAGFELADELVASIDGAHYETMGTLNYGAIVWGQIDPNVSIRVGDDVSDVLLTFHTSHDGTKAFDIYETIYRVVCRNTLRAGSLKRLAQSLRVRHTKNSDARISDLKAGIADIRATAMTMQERLQFLATREQTRESMTTILNRLFPKVKDTEGEDKDSTRRTNILAQVLSLYESNDNNAFPEQRGTSYNLLNAITNYVDHDRVSRGAGSTRAESATFGTGAALKSKALELITEISGTLTSTPMTRTYQAVSSGIGNDIVAELLNA